MQIRIWLYVCAYIDAYMQVCMCGGVMTCIYVYACMGAHMGMVCLCSRICTCVHTYVYVYICVHVSICVFVYVVFIYTFICAYVLYVYGHSIV